jgi:peptide/nickel transport system ATP-binding protein
MNDTSPAAIPLLRIQDLCIDRRIPHARLIHDLSLEIAPAERFALVGASGSGKTLTALAIAGVLPRTMEITGGYIQRGHTAMVFQDARAALNPVRRIGQQFDDVLSAIGIARGQRRQQTRDWLDQVAIADPDDCMRRYPLALSGGMCQRVLIALALARRPALLIADEPTSGLDPYNQAQVLDLLFSLTRQQGANVLLITHDLDLAKARCDRIGVLQNGRLCEIVAARHFGTDARHPYSRALIEATPTLRRILQDRRLATQNHVSTHTSPPSAAPSQSSNEQRVQRPPLLRVVGVRKRFASNPTPALDDVSFNLPDQGVTGLIGKSGSGKSTLAATIARLIDIDGGTMLFDGLDIASTSMRHAASASWRADIQLVFQDARGSLNPLATCRQSIAGALQGKARDKNEASHVRHDVDNMAGLLGLPLSLLERLPHQISGGEAARVGMARALISAPKLLILDEATAALDTRTQADILDMLDSLRRKLGLALLVISHDIALVRMLCDHVIVLEAGTVVEQGDCATVLDTPRHLATRQLLTHENARIAERS